MKELARRSFELFRSYPVLWTPVLIAAFLDLSLSRVQSLGMRWIFRFFSTRHSVLGGTVPEADLGMAQHRTFLAALPLTFLTKFLDVLVFAAALLMTAKLVESLIEERQTGLRLAWRETTSLRLQVVVFSLRYMVALALLGACMVGGSWLLSDLAARPDVVASPWFVLPFTLVSTGAISWLLSPYAVRLLRYPNSVAIEIDIRKAATAFWVLASAMQLGASRLLQHAEAKTLVENAFELNGIVALNTVLTNLPMVWCFVALTLLARQATSEEAFDSPVEEPSADPPAAP